MAIHEILLVMQMKAVFERGKNNSISRFQIPAGAEEYACFVCSSMGYCVSKPSLELISRFVVSWTISEQEAHSNWPKCLPSSDDIRIPTNIGILVDGRLQATPISTRG